MVTKEQAIEKLKRSIDQIDSVKSKGRKSTEYKKWHRDTEVAITYIFGTQSRHLKEFAHLSFRLDFVISGITTDDDFDEAFQTGLESARAVLQSMIQEISEYWSDKTDPSTNLTKELNKKPQGDTIGKDIFIIHGHDEGIKEAVARFLTKIGLNPIILHEQPNQGRTIIEKFQDHSAVSYAIALFTPDDIGSVKTPENLQPRARQNVVFEFGYFIGNLGRKYVCGLFDESVEIPSDYQGVIYIPIDKAGNWRFRLVKELKSVGFDIDANLAL